jgi:hypothetical protein
MLDAPVVLPGTPLPSYKGVLPLLAGIYGVGLLVFGQSWRAELLQLDPGHEWRVLTGAVAVVGCLVLGGWVRLRRSLRARDFARRHLSEPWRWDHPWREEVELPPPEPAASTRLGPSPRRWELRLTSEVPGVDLDTTFVLPIYFSGAP